MTLQEQNAVLAIAIHAAIADGIEDEPSPWAQVAGPAGLDR